MHDLLQEMGFQIVREEYIDGPERRSRLWDFEEIYDVLVNNVGSNQVEGIKLDVSQIGDLHLAADIFKKMPNLRYLKFYSASNSCSSHVQLPKGLKFLPNKMVYLEWYGFPLKSLRFTFCPEKLVILYMKNSYLQKLWNGVQDFVNLQEINLCGSKQLQKLPNLSKCLNLKVVLLRHCESLCNVHSSILSLHSLVKLDLLGCKKLRSLKGEYHLKSLQHIDVNQCWNLKEFSVSSDELRELDLSLTGIEILNSSVGRSSQLKILDLSDLRLVGLPNQLSCLKSLTILKLCNCEIIDDWKLYTLFDGMLSLREVRLNKCCSIIEFPSNTKHLLGLEILVVWNCRRLCSLPELPPSLSTLHADDCKSLEIASFCRPLSGGSKYLSFVNCVQLNEQSLHDIMEAAYSMNKTYGSSITVPGSKVPRWFKYKEAQSSAIVELPQISDLADFFFCIVIGFDSEIYSDILFECKCCLEGFEVAKSQHDVGVLKMKSDHGFIWNDACEFEEIRHGIRRGGNQQLFTNRKLCFKFSVEGLQSSKVMIKECGVWPLYVPKCHKFVEEQQPPLR